MREAADGEQEMTTDTVFAIFSCTKAITGVAVKQLVEEGEISLDRTVRAGDLRHPGSEGFDADGEPRLRPPASTLRSSNCCCTRGFGYDFFNEDLDKYGRERPSVVVFDGIAQFVSLFDPGEQWSTAAT